MRNPLFFAWVKNVHNMGTAAWGNSGFISTGMHTTEQYTLNSVNKLFIIPYVIRTYRPQLPTVFFAQFNLLNGQLFTLSTVPTIKRTKEI